MRQVNQLLGAMFITLLLAFSLNAGEVSDKKHLFISLTSGDLKQSGMGVAIANAMQDAGVETTVFIGANSVRLAMRTGDQEAFGPTGKSVQEMLKALVKKGGKVMVCGMCAKYLEIKKDALVDGVAIISGAEVYGGLFAPNTQTLSF